MQEREKIQCKFLITLAGECCHSNSKYPNSSQRISIKTVEDWERADEIFCKLKICPMKIRKKMVPLKKPLKLEQFLLFQERSKLLPTESVKSSPLIGAVCQERIHGPYA